MDPQDTVIGQNFEYNIIHLFCGAQKNRLIESDFLVPTTYIFVEK